MIASPPPTAYQPYFLGWPASCGTLSEAGAWGSNSDSDRESSNGQPCCDTSCYRPVLSQAEPGSWLESLPSPSLQGKRRRASRQQLREPESRILQWGHVSAAKHFINPGPDSPLWLDCAHCKTRNGEQRWLEATFMLLLSGSSWGLAGPWGRFKWPRARVVAGDC